MPDYVSALKARMGDWQYYVTVMKLGKIARECRLAEDIHPNKDLDALIQRELQDRVQKEMVPYLLNEPQRFYGALVVAVYGGYPDFSPVRVDEHKLIDDKERSSYGFGLLRFDGSQIYYALDGQHRLKSIQEALMSNPDLAKEEIAVIILKHEETREGLQRTRRLFSTLNRRAKPTTAGLNIAIDEDDSIAIVTRRLVKENDILKKLVSTNLKASAISPSKANDPYITTLAAFYETNGILLGGYYGGMEINKDFKQFRRSADELDAYYSFLESIWTGMLEKCPGFDSILNGNKKPGDLRKRLDSNGFTVLDDAGKPVGGRSVRLLLPPLPPRAPGGVLILEMKGAWGHFSNWIPVQLGLRLIASFGVNIMQPSTVPLKYALGARSSSLRVRSVRSLHLEHLWLQPLTALLKD